MAIIITKCTLHDIRQIKHYSVEVWGEKVAADYIRTIDEAIQNLSDHPNLIGEKSEISEHLKFYRVRNHFLVFTTYKKDLYLVAVIHSSMNLPTRLAELEPEMKQEIAIMHQKLMSTKIK